MTEPKSTKPNRDFPEEVFDVVRAIPPGRVTSYGAVAKCLGAARASRRVGWILNKSFGVTPPVPAHRVVNRQGMLTGAIHFPAGPADGRHARSGRRGGERRVRCGL